MMKENKSVVLIFNKYKRRCEMWKTSCRKTSANALGISILQEVGARKGGGLVWECPSLKSDK